MIYLGDQAIGLNIMDKTDWTYEIRPIDLTTEDIVPIQTKVENGQKITIAWDFSNQVENITTRYIWRCIGAGLDGTTSASYAAKTMAAAGNIKKGEETHTVTYSGNILFGGYKAEKDGTSFLGSYIKVKIENGGDT